MAVRPQGRFQDVVVEQREDGAVLRDAGSGESHHFSWPLVKVWSLANGQRTVAEIAGLAELGEDTVASALQELGAKGLLVDASDGALPGRGALWSAGTAVMITAVAVGSLPANLLSLVMQRPSQLARSARLGGRGRRTQG